LNLRKGHRWGITKGINAQSNPPYFSPCEEKKRVIWEKGSLRSLGNTIILKSKEGQTRKKENRNWVAEWNETHLFFERLISKLTNGKMRVKGGLTNQEEGNENKGRAKELIRR